MNVNFLSRKIGGLLLAFTVAATTAPEELEAQSLRKLVKKATGISLPHTPQVIKNLGNSIEKDFKRIERESKQELKRFDKDMQRNFRNFDREANNGLRNVGELGKAAENLVERQLKDSKEALQVARDKLQKGDILGAAEDLKESSLKDIQNNTFQAMQESSALRVIGQTAATAYGGPGGAAAFSAWMTYKGTDGNWDQALKAGAIAYGTGELMGKLNAEPVKGVDIAGKAAAAGVIAAAAVTAAGGDEEDARKAFRDGFIWSAANDIYTNTAGREVDGRGSNGEPCPLGPGYEACLQANPRAPRLGTNPMENPDAQKVFLETRNPMVFISRIPGMHAMSAFHDRWVDVWGMNDFQNKSTIPIATVFTYKALGTDVYGRIIKENIEQAKTKETEKARQDEKPSSSNFAQKMIYLTRANPRYNPAIVCKFPIERMRVNIPHMDPR
jgi:hypothetical protein